MGTWRLEEAKARFDEVLETASRQGAQVITESGVETTVVVPMAEWQRLNGAKGEPNGTMRSEEARRETFLRLLQSAPEFEIPDRHKERLAARKGGRAKPAA